MSRRGSLVIASERVLVEDELRPAVVRIEGDRIDQVWWGTSDPAAVLKPADDLLGGEVLGAVPTPAPQVVELGDRVVLPGVVDTHVHVDEPGRTARAGLASATRAAALCGATTIVEMPLGPLPPTTTVAALDARRAAAEAVRAEGGLHCDVGFWGGAVPGNADDLEPLWDAGVLGFAAFLCDPGAPGLPPLGPDELLGTMDRVARFGGLLMVHADGPTSAPRLLDAVRETGTRTHVPHVSSAHVLDLLAEAKDEGLPVTAETCLHHLVLDAEHDQDALWDGLRAGILDCVAGGHAPATGGQAGFGALADAARRRGVSPADVSRWTSASTAALVGLDRGPRAKGVIAEGAAADLIVYDPEAATTVRAAELAHGDEAGGTGAGATGEGSWGTLLRRPA